MKHAIMIMAHKNVEQIMRLIKSLSTDDIHIFVHIDSEMNVTDSDLRCIESCSNNVFLVKERIHGILDTWTLVEIVLSLIETAKQTEQIKKEHYSYYLLLSGQDYPIKSNTYIVDFLNENYPKPFIDCTPYDENNWLFHKFNFIGFSRVDRYINSKLQRGILRKIIKLPFFISSKVMSIGKKKSCKYFSSYDYDLYGGSAWWILPDIVIDFTIDEMKSNMKKIKRLKGTFTPEETFFQIMTMASPLSDMVDVNTKDMISQNCMTYAHFSDVGKPFNGHPYILTKDDLTKLKELPHLISRKFDMKVDTKIIEMLDELNKI